MLATLSRLKRQLLIPLEDNSQDDELIAQLAAAASAIELYCKREFELKERIERCDMKNSIELFLRCSPVMGIGSILIDGTEINDFELITDTGVVIRRSGWSNASTNVYGGIMLHHHILDRNAGKYKVQVRYTAGYVLPSDADGAPTPTLPASIEQACLIMAKMLHQGDWGKASERIGDYSVTYSVPSAGVEPLLPSVVRALVGPFVRRWIS